MNRTVYALALLLLCASAPPPAFAQTTKKPVAAAPKIDAKAMAILKKSADKMLSLKTFRADCYETTQFAPQKDGKVRANGYAVSKLVATKPNLMRYDYWEASAPSSVAAYTRWKRKAVAPVMSFVSDGKTVWRQFGKIYQKDSHAEADYLTTTSEPWGGFYSPNNSPFSSLQYNQGRGGLLDMTLEKPQIVNSTICDVIHYHAKSEYNGETQKYDTRLFVGRDGVIRRETMTIRFGSRPGYIRDAVIKNIVLNAPVASPKTTFAYTPPKGVTLKEWEKPAKTVEPDLLAKGTAAPDFSATDADGKTVKLSDLRGKVVVIDFWASWCPPCVASMPHNQKVIAKLQAEGLPVVMLAVDNGEKRDAFLAWVKKHPEYNALRFVHAPRETADISGKLYNVSGIPTQYIVDADGTIRWSTVGFDDESDDLEKAIRAASLAKDAATAAPVPAETPTPTD